MSIETGDGTPVLIIGAGPTGLNLALSLARRGVAFRLIDEKQGPGEHSRAMVVQARTLEFYRQFGFADEVVEAGVKVQAAHVREGNENGSSGELVSFRFTDFGEHLTPFPFPLAYPQDDHERLLVSKVKEAGGCIEWETKLVSFTQDEQGVNAKLVRGDSNEELTAHASFICGCDGGHSVVREQLGIGFEGGTYPQLYYVADVKLEQGFERDFVVNLGPKRFDLLLPVRSRGVQRLIGIVPKDLNDKKDLTFEDLRSYVEPFISIKVSEVNWFSTYKVHHRVANNFQQARAFILGDAGHVHSPTGGQGMNTGIGDAVNLGWKLAQVVQGRADRRLLETYESERIKFARSLVRTTDEAFNVIIASGPLGSLGRRYVIPGSLAVASKIKAGQHAFFKAVSQTEIEYEDSEISDGSAGSLRGGDRLPWIDDGTDNFAPLKSLDWQVHVYGTADDELKSACSTLHLPCHAFAWTPAADKADFKKDSAFLVRPDGYIALVLPPKEATTHLASFCENFGIQFQGT